MSEPLITTLRSSDFDEWSRLFHAYIAFYKITLPEEQYRRTFDRILNPNTDLYALVMRNADDESKLIGIAHFFPHQTPWKEEMVMHFNDLFIDPDIRGKGYGRKMIMAVKEEAKKLGCFRLKWQTKHDNIAARKLYDQIATCDFVEYRMQLD